MMAVSSPPARFTGRACIVTGAGKGIGRSIVKGLVDEGISLVVAITRSLEDCVSLEKAFGTSVVVALQADLGDRTSCETAMDKAGELIAERGLQLNYLVNNAGIAENEPLLETRWEKLDETIRVNSYAPLLCTQKAVRNMQKSSGRSGNAAHAGGPPLQGRAIVNVSSVASATALQDHTAYCMSKAAMDMLTKMCALELGPLGVRCNAVNPTVVLTKMGRDNWSGPKSEPLLKQIPMGRFVEESEVVKPLLFLLDSSQSGMLNGACLPIEGGLLPTTKL